MVHQIPDVLQTQDAHPEQTPVALPVHRPLAVLPDKYVSDASDAVVPAHRQTHLGHRCNLDAILLDHHSAHRSQTGPDVDAQRSDVRAAHPEPVEEPYRPDEARSEA